MMALEGVWQFASAAIVAFLIVSVLGQVIHRRYYHSLSAFKGPWLNSISEIPGSLVLLTGRQHSYYRRLHDKYGPIVRVAPNELSFTDADAWQAIYGNRKDGLNMEKSPIFIGAVSPTAGQTGISLAPKEEHARQRRALAYSFTNNALLEQQEIMQVHVDKLIKAMSKRAAMGESVNMSNWFTYTTFDIIGDLCFAEPFGCLDGEASTTWSTSVINVFKSAAWDQAIRRVAGVQTLLQRILVKLIIPKEAANWRKVHFTNSKEKTMRRLANENSKHKDFIYHILQNTEAKKSMTELEIIMNMVLLISAGSETTASLMTGWLWLVCSSQEVYKRVVAEVRGAFASDKQISWNTVKDLPYFEATVSEALRLFSPAPANQQRIVPPGGAMISDKFVPAGTTVAVAPWAASHSIQNFTDPEEFVPERWLGDKRYATDQLHASQPFSMGPRGCIGKNVSFFEIRLILTNLIWNFDVSLTTTGDHGRENKKWSREQDMRHIKVYQTWMKPGLWVDMKPMQH